jgi:hypothetical protein
MAQNPLPPGLRYYSLVTLPTLDRVSRITEKSYKALGAIDWRNDSQVIYTDEIIPGSTLLGFINADHWAIAVPVNRSHRVISRSLVDKNELSARGAARGRAALHRGGPGPLSIAAARQDGGTSSKWRCTGP